MITRTGMTADTHVAKLGRNWKVKLILIFQSLCFTLKYGIINYIFGGVEMFDKKEFSYDLLFDLYIEKGMTIKEICKELKSGEGTVGRELRKHKLTKTSSSYNTKHDMSKTRQYRIWQAMKSRCNLSTMKHFSNYKGKGIDYDPKWQTFEGFWEDMALGYQEHLTLDRIDNSKCYYKENCRWATYTEQNNNKTDNVLIGKSVEELIKITGLSKSAIYNRVRKGWTLEEIINTPKIIGRTKEGI